MYVGVFGFTWGAVLGVFVLFSTQVGKYFTFLQQIILKGHSSQLCTEACSCRKGNDRKQVTITDVFVHSPPVKQH